MFDSPVHNQSAPPGTVKKPFFTSDLSVKEFLFVQDAGFEPLGLVVGSSIYHIGFQKPAFSQSQELTTLTQAMYNARNLAMSRMEAEANQLGADGIVGVDMTIEFIPYEPGLAEFKAIGTAVKSTSGGSYKTAKGLPFTSNLSGQDFWILIKSGYRPVAFVLGNCVYHIGRQSLKTAFGAIAKNVEQETYTQAVYTARELAVSRMRSEGVDGGADGVVGATITEGSQVWENNVIEFSALGTSVVRSGELKIPSPTMVLPMFDQR